MMCSCKEVGSCEQLCQNIDGNDTDCFCGCEERGSRGGEKERKNVFWERENEFFLDNWCLWTGRVMLGKCLKLNGLPKVDPHVSKISWLIEGVDC